jgi:Fic family protein
MKLPLAPPDFKPDADTMMKIASFPWSPLINGRYLHWDQVRHRPPPKGISHEAWWVSIKLARMGNCVSLPLLDEHGRSFVYSTPSPVIEKLHIIDTMGGGQLKAPRILKNEAVQDRHLVSSLVEEAIASSQLEGAATTRPQAKAMLRYGRKPTNQHEQMILNNYMAAKSISEMRGQPVTLDGLLDLHRTLVKGTISADEVGRFQEPHEERVIVRHEADGLVLHEPPSAKDLPARMQRVMKFLNAGQKQGQFLHPIIKAIIGHFFVAYEHPFADGNGRAARGMFYWLANNADYWVLEFASISSILRASPAKYARSFLYTETDDNDLTYFIDYQLDVIVRALKELEHYIAKKAAEIGEAEDRLRNTKGLNYRQLALLSHALREPTTVYTVRSHQNSHNVSYNTARSDLRALVGKGFLLELPGRGQGYTVDKDWH